MTICVISVLQNEKVPDENVLKIHFHTSVNVLNILNYRTWKLVKVGVGAGAKGGTGAGSRWQEMGQNSQFNAFFLLQ